MALQSCPPMTRMLVALLALAVPTTEASAQSRTYYDSAEGGLGEAVIRHGALPGSVASAGARGAGGCRCTGSGLCLL